MELLATNGRSGAPRRRRAALWLGAIALAAAAGAGADEPARSEGGGALRVEWRAGLGDELGRAMAVDDAGGTLVSRGRHCELLDAGSGRVRWSRKRGAAVPGGLALGAQGVFGVSDAPEEQLFCLDPADGRERWRVALGEAWMAPLVRDSTVYASSTAGSVRAVDARDGRAIWSFSAPSAVRASLAWAAGVILVPTQRDSLIALDAASGDVRWGLAPGGALLGSLAVAGGRAWCLSYDGTLTAFDAFSGEVQGRRRLEGFFRAGLGGRDPLLALSTAGRIYAIEPLSLTVLWMHDLGVAADVTPSVGRDLVWVGLWDGTVRALRRSDGREAMRLTLPGPIACPILAHEAAIRVGAGGGQVVAYRWIGGVRRKPRAARPAVGWSGLPALGASGDGGVRPLAPLSSDVRPRPAPSLRSAGRNGSPLGRWAWTAGWVLGSALALGLQREADRAYEEYQGTGDPAAREARWDRARRLDHGVVASWAASEVCFALGVRAWLRFAKGEGRRP